MTPQGYLSLLLPLVATATECPYESYDGAILVADATYCSTAAPVCAVDKACRRLLSHNISSDQVKYSGYTAVGNLTAYPHDELYIGNITHVNVEDMELPSTLRTLSFDNVSTISLDDLYGDVIANITELCGIPEFVSCGLGVIPWLFEWPPRLETLTLLDNELQTIPKALPPTLRELAIQDNALTDLVYLPDGLTFLNLYDNSLENITDKNWTQLTFLRLGDNPIKTITNVHLSKQLRFFDCEGCPITNMVLTPETFEALDVLSVHNGDQTNFEGFVITRDIESDGNACSAIGGTIRDLWQHKSNVTVRVCVTLPHSTNGPF
ncbi:hypothetical protein SDRG_13348 [Saprolegnia diclina VS20]|uniref:Uncharacterized protein n=1 Tax=Saprolegnia diclina (strain VS20) TaxID=1156394 RepID=T0RA56_SAPDV|nr:hypothetical protein SDRG_13348 [Saprolegnia diclina VS20]EQC29013.1 hypothetical protein SDRG_13348 [Saprolegnia diclina VS20]|eukprot:XP_008617652.1 hypothetical protein SDRG_13348 [Saprolegnia diclina VS20]